ncbi:hypothetical protein H5410_017365 [Solanum commersonii]|uniref:Uncharacterized protein n=1 Tax=Solanum commersonii TaxID=4109 RepID=A0A9J5ZYY2_SOLCO|nr:hypothetical protein H5410_017365 [Solanum commersonii]
MKGVNSDPKVDGMGIWGPIGGWGDAFLLIQLTAMTQNSNCRKRPNILITGGDDYGGFSGGGDRASPHQRRQFR